MPNLQRRELVARRRVGRWLCRRTCMLQAGSTRLAQAKAPLESPFSASQACGFCCKVPNDSFRSLSYSGGEGRVVMLLQPGRAGRARQMHRHVGAQPSARRTSACSAPNSSETASPVSRFFITKASVGGLASVLLAACVAVSDAYFRRY